ncbi:hypothetical protein BDZ45DRAFT_545421, partial [Acephala macrosclerotiorum]
NVFIYEEHSSGIKSWTDSVLWSSSQILGDFLVYCELECSFPSSYNPVSAAAPTFDSSTNSLSKETERSLIGSLVDSYGLKEESLVKKTVSITVGSVSHHLASYDTVADVMNNKFTTPSKDPRFQHITPQPGLVEFQ